jgi:hypothetical protein
MPPHSFSHFQVEVRDSGRSEGSALVFAFWWEPSASAEGLDFSPATGPQIPKRFSAGNLNRWPPKSSACILNLRGNPQHSLFLPRTPYNLHSNRQSFRRFPHRHRRRRNSQQIEPLRIGHRFQVFDFPPRHRPFALPMRKRWHRAHWAQQNRKLLHLRQKRITQHVAPQQGIQQLGRTQWPISRHACPKVAQQRADSFVLPIQHRRKRHLPRSPEKIPPVLPDSIQVLRPPRFHFESPRAQRIGSFAHGGRCFRRHWRRTIIFKVSHTQPANLVVLPPPNAHRSRTRIARIRPRHHFEKPLHIAHRSRHWPHHAKISKRTGRTREMSSRWNPSRCRLQSANPCEMRRNPNRSASIATYASGRTSGRLDPPAVRARSQGLFTRPYIELSLSYAIRNSGTLVFPRMIAPAPRSRATSGASASGVLPFRSTLPHSHASPATSIELFTVTGTPCRVPSAFFPLGVAAAASAAFALARARSASTFANAFNFGFSRSIRARCASTSSTGEISPARTCSAIPISDPYTISSTWPPHTPRKPLKRAAVYHAAITTHRPIAE